MTILRSFQTLTVFSLVAGITLVASGLSTIALEGNVLSGPGSTLTMESMQESAPLKGAAFVPAPFAPAYEQAAAGESLVVGLLLILLGFFLHAMIVSRTVDNGERPVHVTAIPSSSGGRKSRNPIAAQRFYWVELKI